MYKRQILEGFGHLNKMGVALPAGNGSDIILKAVPYIDSRMIEWYDELKKLEAKGKLKMSDLQISSMQLHYLYTRSFFPNIEHPAQIDEINGYLRAQIEKYWLQFGIYDQGLTALASFRTWPQASVSKEILEMCIRDRNKSPFLQASNPLAFLERNCWLSWSIGIFLHYI